MEISTKGYDSPEGKSIDSPPHHTGTISSFHLEETKEWRSIHSTLDEIALQVRTAGIRRGRENSLIDHVEQVKRKLKDASDKTEQLWRTTNNLYLEKLYVVQKEADEAHERLQSSCISEMNDTMAKLKREHETEIEDMKEAQQEILLFKENEHKKKLKKIHDRYLNWKNEYQSKIEQAMDLSMECRELTQQSRVDDTFQELHIKYSSALEEKNNEMKEAKKKEQELRAEIRDCKKVLRQVGVSMESLKEEKRRLKKSLCSAKSDVVHFEGLYKSLMAAFQEQQHDYTARIIELDNKKNELQIKYATDVRKIKDDKTSDLDLISNRVQMTVDKQAQAIENLRDQLQKVTQRALASERALEELSAGLHSRERWRDGE